MYPAQFHPDKTSLHPEFWYVCLQVHPTIISHYEQISATGEYVHLCETAGFARHFRTPSFVAARMHGVRGLLFCAFWSVEQSQAGKRSTFRTPSVINPRVKEETAALNCLPGDPNGKCLRLRAVPVYVRFLLLCRLGEFHLQGCDVGVDVVVFSRFKAQVHITKRLACSRDEGFHQFA